MVDCNFYSTSVPCFFWPIDMQFFSLRSVTVGFYTIFSSSVMTSPFFASSLLYEFIVPVLRLIVFSVICFFTSWNTDIQDNFRNDEIHHIWVLAVFWRNWLNSIPSIEQPNRSLNGISHLNIIAFRQNRWIKQYPYTIFVVYPRRI